MLSPVDRVAPATVKEVRVREFLSAKASGVMLIVTGPNWME